MSAQPSPHATDDRLIDLAHGLLEPVESSACLAHLGRCAACEDRFRAIVGERARVAAEHALPLATSRRRVFAAAVVAALLTTAVLLGIRRDAEPGRVAYWLPIEREEAVLRSEAESDSGAEIGRGLVAYRSHDAALAVRLLAAARVPQDHEPLRDLYLASALELDGRLAEAARVLDRLNVDTLPEPWRTQARWVDYRVARGLGDDGRAAALLGRLESAPGEIGDLARRERER